VSNGIMDGADKIRVFRRAWDVWRMVEGLTDNSLIITSDRKVAGGKAM